LDFCLDPAVDAAVAKCGYTPKSTGDSLAFLFAAWCINAKLYEERSKIKVLAMQQAAISEGLYS
jgi:hypothetical protein